MQGLLVGKFDPPHRGHSLVVDIACAYVEKLTVVVWDFPEQTIPPETRAAWLREIHPDIDVRVLADASTMAGDTTSWAARITDAGISADTLFSSEPYGEQLAHELFMQHVNVDRDRRWVPCTSTMIRHNPLDNLRWIGACVRAHYVKRICIAGAESTGKTSLCEQLAVRFDTAFVREYGREYSIIKYEEGELGHWRSDEFLHIAREQQRREDEAARGANRLLFCDTDALATRIWHERYLGEEPAMWPLPPSVISLYLLPYPDVPFVADEIRDGEHMRFWMFERFVAECERIGVPHLVVRGDWDERFSIAVEAVERLVAAPAPTP